MINNSKHDKFTHTYTYYQFFHARFVPHGWNKPYEWSEADLETATHLVMKNSLDDQLETERGLLDAAIYGGRILDGFDVLALEAIMREVWSKEVINGNVKLGGVLSLPDSCRDSGAALDQLSDVDLPKEYFGLPANANRSWERSAAEAALAIFKGIQGDSLVQEVRVATC